MWIYTDEAIKNYSHLLRFEYDLFREVILDRLLTYLGYGLSKKRDNTWLNRITQRTPPNEEHPKDFYTCSHDVVTMFSSSELHKISAPTTAMSYLLEPGGADLERSLMSCISEEPQLFSSAELQLIDQAISDYEEKDMEIREKLDAFIVYHLKLRIFPASSIPSRSGSRTRFDYWIPLLKPFAEQVAPTLLLPTTSKRLLQIINFHAGIYDPIEGYEHECEFLKLQNEQILPYAQTERETYATLWH